MLFLYCQFLFLLLFAFPLFSSAQGVENDELMPDQAFLPQYDLNALDNTGFRQLGLLSAYQVQSVLAYRERYGGFSTVYELQLVSGIDAELYERLLGVFYVQAAKEYDVKRRASYLSTNLFAPITVDGYDKSHSFVDNMKIQHRIACAKIEHFPFYALLEKDSGESIEAGYDYFSFAVEHPWGKNCMVVAGDYMLSLGQGLACSTVPLFNFYGAEPYRKRFVLRANSSFSENASMRGVASLMCWKKFVFISAVSKRSLNATVTDRGFSSLYDYGVHSDSSSLQKKHRLRSSRFVLSAMLRSDYFETAFLIHSNTFDKDYQPADETLLQNNNLSGGYKFSHFYKASYKLIDLWGETALDNNGKLALLHGINLELGDDTEVCVQYHRFDPGFLTFGSQGFSVHSYVANESACYVAFLNRSFEGVCLSASFSSASHFADRYRISKGERCLKSRMSAEYVFASGVKVVAVYRFKQSDGEEIVAGMVNKQFFLKSQHAVQCKISSKPIRFMCVSAMVENKFSDNWERTRGLLGYAEVSVDKAAFYGALRFAMFSAEYDARIYVYERSLPQTFSIPSYYGEGLAQYVFLQKKIRRYTFALKCERVLKFNARKENENRFSVGTHVKCRF